MKKLFLILVLCLCSLASWAQDENYDFYDNSTGPRLYYKITSPTTVEVVPPTGISWTGFTPPTGSLTIPSSVTNGGTTYSVTSIGEDAFRGCSSLTGVIIPNSVTSIGGTAFFGSGLTGITIPAAVTSIGWQAFANCPSLATMTVEAGNTIYDSRNSCNALIETATNTLVAGTQNTVIPNTVTCIGEFAFRGSGITGITIPNSVTTMGECVFYECSGLTHITIHYSVTTIGRCAFEGCHGLTSVTIPISVTTIGTSAFSDCSSLSHLSVPNSVITIAGNAFEGVDTVYYRGNAAENPWGAATVITDGYTEDGDPLVYESPYKTIVIDCNTAATNVIIPNSVASIESYAFEGCGSLTSVTIGNSVTTIGGSAFEGCSGLTSLAIGNSVTTIGERAFLGCSGLTSLTIGNSVTTIGGSAFQGCSGLTSLAIGNSVTTIGRSAFQGCTNVTTLYYNAQNLTSNSVWYVGADNFGFSEMPLQTLVIGDSVETLPEGVFYGQVGLTSLTIGNSVTTIGESAFRVCSNLTSVTLPNSLTTIGARAFLGCSGLTHITIPDSVIVIGNGAFESCNGLTSVTIGNSVTTIGGSAFLGCWGLTSVTIPNSVTSIGNNSFFSAVDTIWYCGTAEGRPWGAQTVMGPLQDGLFFEDCDMTIVNGFEAGLTHADIPSSVTTIASNAFKNCTTLTSVTIPESVTTIGNSAFEGCSNVTTLNYNAKNLTTTADWHNSNSYGFRPMPLQTLVIGDSVETLPEGVFYGQNNVDTLYYNAKNLTTTAEWYNASSDYNNYGFRMMSLQTLVIGDSVKTLPAGVFYGLDDLTSVTIPEAVATIEKHAFEGCTNVTTLYYNATNLTTDNFWHNALDSNNSYGFRPMHLQTLVIGDNVETIPQGVFYNQQGLTTLTIPESVSRIETAAFYRCSNVTTLYYNATNLSGLGKNAYDGFRPMKLQTLVIGDNVETLPDSVFYSQTDLTHVTLPNSLTSIGAFAFCYDSNLTDLTLPESLTSIGNSAFAHCKRFPSIDFPESLNSIGASAFYNCSALTTLTIPETLTSIGNSAFAYCKGLTSVSLPESMTSISNGVFQGCSGLTSVTLPNAVTTIGAEAFRGCTNLASITIPNSVTTIGNNAFMDCNGLTYVTLPNAISIIEDNTFNGCSSLAHITIPQSVTTIDIHAFENCTSLTNVIIPNSVTTIGASAFSGCTGLESIVIGKSVNSFGSAAFDNCTSLWTIYNLSVWNIEPSSTNFGYGRVAINAKRVLSAANGDFTNIGAGENTLHQINYPKYTIVDAEDNTWNHIPRSTIPANFIYYYNSNQKGWSWKANEIFLTDDTSRFVAPVEFTAAKATYSREFTNSNRSTLCLPFTAAVPEGFEVYDFSGFDGHTLTFSNHEGNIAAYTPYLVGYDLSKEVNTTQCTITQENVAFPASSSAAAPTPINGMTFQGTTVRTCMTDNNYGYRDGFFVQSANGSGHDAHAHVNPFRAYFTYSPSSDAPQSLPPTLNVEVSYGDPVGIDAVETPEQEYDNRYGKDVYDMLGRLVRKNADNLEGLPKGVYIWKGRKHVVS